jgi:hypothetical protein
MYSSTSNDEAMAASPASTSRTARVKARVPSDW